MSLGRENDIIYNLTRPSSDFAKQLAVRELVEYLRSRKNYLDDALADLISTDGNSELHFDLKKRDARRVLSEFEVDRDVKTFEFVRELTGRVATRTLVHNIRDQIADSGRTIRLEGHAYVVRKNGFKEFSIQANKPISETCAERVASLLPNASPFQTIKTMIAKTKKAINSQ
jgi:hypothetical protein